MSVQPTSVVANQIFKKVVKNLPDQLQICIENCMSCHQICVVTLSYCIEKGGKHVEGNHLKQLIDCAQICTVSADFISRESDISYSVCVACAEACSACAVSCEMFPDDEFMKNCAAMCRQCADSCKQVAVKH